MSVLSSYVAHDFNPGNCQAIMLQVQHMQMLQLWLLTKPM